MISLLILACVSLAPDLIEPENPVCIDATGSRWRRPVHVDAVEHALVEGAWRTPAPGDVVVLPDGTDRTWRSMASDERPSGPRGGYVVYTFESNERYPALLDARGHSFAYVNGRPRGGDVYNRGTLRLPFMVQKGTNELVFRSGRGPLKPRVQSASAVAMNEMPTPSDRVVFMGKQDRTLPDLIRGEAVDTMGSTLVYNVTESSVNDLVIDVRLGDTITSTIVSTLPALSFLKTPFMIRGDIPESASSIDIEMTLRQGDMILDVETVQLKVRESTDLHRRTFMSDIDGSVQYYAVRPANGKSESPPGIALSLHGASVEAQRQASCYRPRDWVHVVAPTNRRPFGFDWEHWGRLDAMEVLADAEARYQNDPDRRWLTGHSMGGHGTWQLGATFPDRWAAIAPSAGWVSFWTYGGPDRYARDGGVQEILRRAANPSDTLLMRENLDQFGIYVLHGDADDNVPVTQARMMRKSLATSHPDWTYYERPGAGHWWGDQCMDWPPLFEFLRERSLPEPGSIDEIEFVTLDPRASSSNHWARIHTQIVALEPSRIELERDRDGLVISGSTENVRRLSLDVSELTPGNDGIQIEIDGSSIQSGSDDQLVHLINDGDQWMITDRPPLSEKGPHRAGPFRDAFNNEVVLVYGTGGDDDETNRLAARARVDSERWWYRANGHLPFVADVDFNPEEYPDRNVVLYGNSDTNLHWSAMLDDSPIQVANGRVRIGHDVHEGDDLSAIFIRPRPGSDVASVGVVAATGIRGDRLSEQLPLFLAGVGWPDWIVLNTDVLKSGTAGIIDTGFFDEAWRLDENESH